MFKYIGVILAAGIGSRIHPLNVDLPKPLLPVLNKPIVQYQLESMLEVGIRDVIIVCNHLKEKFESYFGDGSSLGAQIRYVNQKEPLGIAHALSKVEPYIDRPFLLFLGDIFFAGSRLDLMIELFEKRAASGLLAVVDETNPDFLKRNFAVVLHESGMVRRVIEKPRHSRTILKGCGLYLFDPAIFDAVRRTPKTAMRDEYEITSSIQIFIDDGYPVFPVDAVEWDMNITTIGDLWLCNQKMLRAQGKGILIGEHVRLPHGAEIRDSVIGDNVAIETCIKISNSLILPGSHVTGADDLINVVGYKDEVFRQVC